MAKMFLEKLHGGPEREKESRTDWSGLGIKGIFKLSNKGSKWFRGMGFFTNC